MSTVVAESTGPVAPQAQEPVVEQREAEQREPSSKGKSDLSEISMKVYEGLVAGKRPVDIARSLSLTDQAVQYHRRRLLGHGYVIPTRGKKPGPKPKRGGESPAVPSTVKKSSTEAFSAADYQRGLEFIRSGGGLRRAARLMEEIGRCVQQS